MFKQRTPHLLILCVLVFVLFLRSFPADPMYTDQECLVCHGKINCAQILKNGVVRSLYVDPVEWAQDMHKKGELACVDYHIHANPYVHFREGFVDVDCAKCHPERSEEYLRNVHFESAPLSPDRELPLCYHCHTKHHILRHDDPSASINENNIDTTCGECHSEVMVKGLLKGSSIGKISGHRKGDISEKYDMNICIQCHNPAHGSNTVYKEFCTRCHDPNQTPNAVIGPTHLDSTKWASYNAVGGSLVLFLILGTFVYLGFKSRGELGKRIKDWHESMKVPEERGGNNKVDVPKEEDKKQENTESDEEPEIEKGEGTGKDAKHRDPEREKNDP